MQREDLKGKMVRYHHGREAGDWYPALIIAIYPNGHADLTVFVPAANGTWYHSDAAFSPKGGTAGTWFLTPELIQVFQELFTGKKALPVEAPKPTTTEEVMSTRVTHDNLFVSDKPERAEQAHSGVQTKPAAGEPVRKSANKPPRL